MKHGDYPDEYPEMFQKAVKVPVVLKFSTHEKAVAFRVELYKYRWKVRDELPKTKVLYNAVMKVTMPIKGNVLMLKTKKSKFVEKLNEH